MVRTSINLFAMMALALVLPPALASAQILEEAESAAGPQYGEPQTIRFRVGAEITASRGACRGIVAMVTVPLECPEQEVKILEEDFSAEVGEVSYRMLQEGARQMLISVPFLPSGATASAVITAEVSTRPVLPPEQTDELKIPKRAGRQLRRFLSGSPYIEVKHQRVRSL